MAGNDIEILIFLEEDLKFWEENGFEFRRESMMGTLVILSLKTFWSNSLGCIQNRSLHHTVVATLRLTEMIPTVNECNRVKNGGVNEL